MTWLDGSICKGYWAKDKMWGHFKCYEGEKCVLKGLF